ncbi:lipoxygenase homology domain-containing protein 1-like [Scyliorhinus torazame]|uniref:lipoxygenase homology domain-containing protein 1-like n=1 Tax=Scyliorhinus torazame TaxID=75743 RepID=UPI003B594322
MMMKLQRYDFELIYTPGKHIVEADTLSRATAALDGNSMGEDVDMITKTPSVNVAIQSKKPPIVKKIPLSGMLNHERKSTPSLHSVKDPNSREALKELDEYLVEIYTGDEFGDSTNANVYIVLFGDKAHSDKILLTESLDHVNLFQKGQVDKFKIKTDLLGSLYKIEIGHDTGIPGSGWFLEKIEITNTVTKENLIFPCNRWLTLDIGTVVQLYLREI